MSLTCRSMLVPATGFRWLQFSGTIILAMFGALYMACAQPESATPNNADPGKAEVDRGVNVDRSSRPQTKPEEGVSVPPPPRPRGGVSDEEYKERKERAAKTLPPGSSEPNESVPPPSPRGR